MTQTMPNKTSSEMLGLMKFFGETERLKSELRHSFLSDGRQESVAEHTWMMSLMAVVMTTRLNVSVDLLKVLKMIIIHDIAEVIIGDIPSFEDSERQDRKQADEFKAMQKLLSTLPKVLEVEFFEVWNEYEAGASVESKFARALDHIEVQHQHNLAPFSTWEAFETDLVYTKMDDRAEFDSSIVEFVAAVRSQAEELMMKNDVDVTELRQRHNVS